MAYDANPAATHNPTTGVVVPTAWLDLINSNFADIGAQWTSYTPAWTSTGVAPAIGNGSITGAALKLGKTMFIRILWIAGSTTTFGTGIYYFGFPAATTSVGQVQLATARGYDASAAANYVLGAFAAASTTRFELVSNGSGSVAATSPVTWANGDSILIEGVIELS